MEEKEISKTEALNVFLNEIFNQQMPKQFPDIEVDKVNRALYFKIWCGGVNAGLELDVAIKQIKGKI